MVSSKQVYGLTTPFVNVFPDPITKTRAPTDNDKNYPNGFVWIYKNGDIRTSYINGGLDSSGNPVWILAGAGETDIDTLSGDTGVANPTNGNINLAGGANITTVGAASTVTFNMDDAISLVTSVTSPLYTTASGNMNIQGPAGNDVSMILGDSLGESRFLVRALDLTTRLSIGSNGSISLVGNVVLTDGPFNVGQDNETNAINIGGGSSTRVISIGNGTGDHTISIGQSAAGTISLTTAANVSVVSSKDDGDAIILNASGGAGAIQLLSGTGGLLMGSGQTVNVTSLVVGQSPYTILGSDFLLSVNTNGGAITVTLPASPPTGAKYVIAGREAADGNNVTIDGNGNNISKLEVNAATAVIDTKYGTMTLYFNGNNWIGIYV